jgi:hypothetical protein
MQPDWAVEHARAALKIGMKVPEVEKLLVAKGLPPAQANEVVMTIIEGRVGQAAAAVQSKERSSSVQLALSVIVAAVCIALAYCFGGDSPAAWSLACLLPGLAFIWLPEMRGWQWGLTPRASRICGWTWIFLVGVGRVVLIAIWNRPV